MKNIIVLFGGRSTEHEISLRSARNVLNELDRSRYRIYGVYLDKQGRFLPLGEITAPLERPEDLIRTTSSSRLNSIADFCRFVAQLEQPVAFPVIHGQTGEDGEIQGFLQMLGIPYVGAGLTASALCMDKGFANHIFRDCGIPEARFVVLTQHEYANAEPDALFSSILEQCGPSCFVKPANNGSSVGVMRATEHTLREAIENAFRYDHRIVIEQEIVGCELEVSVLGNTAAKASKPGSYTTTREMLDYTAKYNDRQTIENVPHPLSKEKTAQLQELALRAYHATGCEGLARVDIFMDEEQNFFVNEINTMPGMTPTSLAAKLWTVLTDMTFSEYLDALIAYAEESAQNRASIETTWGQK